MENENTFKKHMILWAQHGEGFATVCGINDQASEEFKETAEFSDFGDVEKTTCQKCLAGFGKLVEAENNVK